MWGVEIAFLKPLDAVCGLLFDVLTDLFKCDCVCAGVCECMRMCVRLLAVVGVLFAFVRVRND